METFLSIFHSDRRKHTTRLVSQSACDFAWFFFVAKFKVCIFFFAIECQPGKRSQTLKQLCDSPRNDIDEVVGHIAVARIPGHLKDLIKPDVCKSYVVKTPIL